MDARFENRNSMDRCMAAACSSARICAGLDATVILVVSICVVCVRIMLTCA